jgi:hypothetical protein
MQDSNISETDCQSGITGSQPSAPAGHGDPASARLRAARLLPPTPSIAERLLQHNRRVVALVVAASYGNDAEVSRLLDDPKAEPFLDSILDAAAREATAASVAVIDEEPERWDGMS